MKTMKVKYIPNYKEWIVDTNNRTYRIAIVHHEYIIEEICEPDGELKYCTDYKTLGAALETLMRDEMFEQLASREATVKQ